MKEMTESEILSLKFYNKTNKAFYSVDKLFLRKIDLLIPFLFPIAYAYCRQLQFSRRYLTKFSMVNVEVKIFHSVLLVEQNSFEAIQEHSVKENEGV